MIDGHEVEVDDEMVTLSTSSVIIEEFESSLRLKILSAIASPEIVLILGMIGLYGLMYEGWNPGAIIPGVVGVILNDEHRPGLRPWTGDEGGIHENNITALHTHP